MRSLECGLKAQAFGILLVWGVASVVLKKVYKDDPRVNVSNALFSGFLFSLVVFFTGHIIKSLFEPIIITSDDSNNDVTPLLIFAKKANAKKKVLLQASRKSSKENACPRLSPVSEE